MTNKNASLFAPRKAFRAPAKGFMVAEDAPRNWMGSAGFGSFSYFGDDFSEVLPEAAPRVFLSVEVGERCQLHCRHCIYHRDEKMGQPPSPIVGEKISSALAKGFDPLWVSFSGKEPTLFPKELYELASLVRKPGRTNIMMTNGLNLKGPLLDRMAKVIDCFDISLDGDEDAHNWMRGKGTFSRTWRNIGEVLDKTPRKVGLIATLVHSALPDGKPQHESLVALARRLETRYRTDPRIMLTVSLYYGPPGDPLLLEAKDIVSLIRNLSDIDFPVRILFTANYAHLWPEVSQMMGWDDLTPVFDPVTGFAQIRRAHISLLLFNLSVGPQIGLRVSNEGRVFLSCNHLTLGQEGTDLHVGDLHDEDLEAIARRAATGTTRYSDALANLPQDCITCTTWEKCGGGDRLSGIYFDKLPIDPYCSRIARPAT